MLLTRARCLPVLPPRQDQDRAQMRAFLVSRWMALPDRRKTGDSFVSL